MFYATRSTVFLRLFVVYMRHDKELSKLFIVRLWNTICTSAPKTIFSSLNTFQNYVKETLFDSLKTFDVEWLCTWSSVRLCACHRP